MSSIDDMINRVKKQEEPVEQSQPAGGIDSMLQKIQQNQPMKMEEGEAYLTTPEQAGIPDVFKPNPVKKFFSDTWSVMKPNAINMAGGLVKAEEQIINAYGKLGDKVNELPTWARTAIRVTGLPGVYVDAIALASKANIDEPVEAFLDKNADKLFETAQRNASDVDLDIIQSVKDGDYGSAIYKMFVGAGGNLPSFLVVAGTSALGAPQVGLGAVGMSTYGSKYKEVEDREDMTEEQKQGVALVHGAAEMFFESIGSSETVQQLMANKAIRNGLKKEFVKLMARAAFSEPMEEVGTSITQDIADYYFGVDDEFDYRQIGKNAGNAAIMALPMAGAFTATGAIQNQMNKSKTLAEVETTQVEETQIDNTPTPIEDVKKPTAVQLNMNERAAQDLAGQIIEHYDYKDSKLEEVTDLVIAADKWGRRMNVNPETVLALMKIESDYSNVGNKVSSAKGALQVTNIVVKDLNRVGMVLENDIMTLEGRVEAGVKYLDMLKNVYKFSGDEIIAAYFSGVGYVNKNGIDDVVQHGQISNREYVNRYREAIEVVKGFTPKVPVEVKSDPFLADSPSSNSNNEITKTELKKTSEEGLETYINLLSGKQQVSEVRATELDTTNKPANGADKNTTKVETNKQVKEVLETFTNKVEDYVARNTIEQQGKKIAQGIDNLDSVVKLADELIQQSKDIKKGFDATQAARDIEIALQEKIQPLAKKYVEASNELNNNKKLTNEQRVQLAADMMEARNYITQYKEVSDHLLKATKQVGAELSRGLGNLQINADGTGIDIRLNKQAEQPQQQPQDWGVDITSINDDTISNWAKGHFDTSKADTITKVEKAHRLLGALAEYRVGNLFQHVDTSVRATVGQLTNILTDGLTDINEVGLNFLKLGKGDKTLNEVIRRGTRTITGVGDAFAKPVVTFKEAGQTVAGKTYSKFELMTLAVKNPKLFEQIKDATQRNNLKKIEGFDGKKISKEYLQPAFSNFDFENGTIGQFLGKGLDYFGAVHRLISFGGLEIVDSAFYNSAYEAEVSGLLYRLRNTYDKKTLDEVKKLVPLVRKFKTALPYIEQMAKDLTESRAIEFKDAFKEIIVDRVGEEFYDSMTKGTEEFGLAVEFDSKADQKGREMTFRDEWADGSIFKEVEQFVNRHPFFKIIFPFLHTPFKILTKALDHTPASKKIYIDFKSGDVNKQTNAAARLLTGIELTTLGLLLALSGHLTPAARNKEEKERWQEAGLQPNSIRIGDKWYNYLPLDTFGYFCIATSTLARSFQEAAENSDSLSETSGKIAERAAVAIFDMVSATFDQTFLEGLSQAVEAMESANKFERFSNNIKQSMMPGASFKKNFTDHPLYGLNPLFKEHYERDNMIMRDRYGEPIYKNSTLFGLKYKERTGESSIRELVYLKNINLPPLKDTIHGYDLSAEEYNTMLEWFGETLKPEQVMNEFVASEPVQRLLKNGDDINLRKILTNKWDTLRERAQIEFMRKKENLDKIKAEQMKEEKLNIWIPDRNVQDNQLEKFKDFLYGE